MGGPGSGNFGHGGRPGEVGGSSAEGESFKETSSTLGKLRESDPRESWGVLSEPRKVYTRSEATIDIPDREEIMNIDPAKDITNQEYQSMNWWKGTGYEVIQQYNENKSDTLFPPDSERCEAAIKDIDHVLSKSELKQDVTVYRGISPRIAGKLQEYGEYKNKNYTSTSVNPDVALDFAELGQAEIVDDKNNLVDTRARNIMMFNVPKGSNGYFYKSESEVLLPRGLSLKVTGVTEFQKGIRINVIRGGDYDKTVSYDEDVPIRVYTMEMKK